ncbi:TauD/TfdA family dioxygenase [Actinokineospora auranticolor]|uniref:L-asparagine oxygenase n=1 Tax=Actinokineospora auranticolor TaxID=155976 RepID=A0A2S6GB77_9PSEU|nr:TauD/TfdA family dioxygenase [Actinokineospora auranticolor]PPK60988.1 L-asparagine oxygenase [Actinokineospora auranticolor]
MTVDVLPEHGTDHVITLTGPERAEVETTARHLADLAPRLLDSPEWLAGAREASATLPVRLRQAIRRFTHDAGRDGVFLVRNLPVDAAALPPTPNVPGSVQRETTVAAAAEVLVGLNLGEPLAFREEKSGALVQDVVPVPGMEKFQGNAGSVALAMHVENAFHPYRPDYVGLHCLRNDHDNQAGLLLASIRNALPALPDEVREILRSPRYTTAPPASFGALGADPRPHGILSGSWDDPDIQVDFESTHPLDGEAEQAMAVLGDALRSVRRTFVLETGDLAFVDNRLTLHGRTEFTPRYDGRDRWLQRVFIHQNHRRSRVLRPTTAHVLVS